MKKSQTHTQKSRGRVDCTYFEGGHLPHSPETAVSLGTAQEAGLASAHGRSLQGRGLGLLPSGRSKLWSTVSAYTGQSSINTHIWTIFAVPLSLTGVHCHFPGSRAPGVLDMAHVSNTHWTVIIHLGLHPLPGTYTFIYLFLIFIIFTILCAGVCTYHGTSVEAGHISLTEK